MYNTAVMSVTDHFHDAEEQVRTAYADVHDDKVHKERCLSFLTSHFVSIDAVTELTSLIGRYNRFTPHRVNSLLNEVAENDPEARVAVGREGSPVLYVETTNPEMVKGVFANYPDEVMDVEQEGVGNARTYEGEDWDIDAHSTCRHDTPVVPVTEYPECDSDKSYVRLWWD